MEPSQRSGGRGLGQHRGGNHASAGAEPKKAKRPKRVHLKGNGSLERLQERVELTLLEVSRLREENAALSERLNELESNPLVHLDANYVAFEEHPELLRRKVDQFIAAIDTYLGQESSAADDPTDGDHDREEEGA
ncbi:MAG: hypothetical protein AAF730_09425 [Bacteroidota bacterium]